MSIRIWFLIQQFVARHDLPGNNHIPFVNYIHCRRCRARLAYIHSINSSVQENGLVCAELTIRLCNRGLALNGRHGRVIDGMIQAETYCLQCRHLIGWRIIAAFDPSLRSRVGGVRLRMNELICWNNVTLNDFIRGGNNEQAPNDQDGGANVQNANQEGDADEQALGNNEQNVDRDADANGQDLGVNEQNADQDVNGCINEQVPSQDVDIAEGMGNIDQNTNI